MNELTAGCGHEQSNLVFGIHNQETDVVCYSCAMNRISSNSTDLIQDTVTTVANEQLEIDAF